MKRLLSYYADDFTGATDVMEALASHDVNTVLFTKLPSLEEFAPFQEFQAFGIAGTSRSQTPSWMDENLPAPFQWLKELEAQFCHYKVCSTFDSSPLIGNIGRATEIGMDVFQQDVVPLVVGAPQLKRYTFAGHLFAGYQGETYRIDRHPVMSRHPVTPMDEADLRLHLAQQTSLPISLVTDHLPPRGIGLYDVYDEATQRAVGEKLLDQTNRFLVGSSGVEYALVKALHHRKEISGSRVFAPIEKVDRMLAVSGSVSPTTERQIRFSLQNGFSGIAVDPISLSDARREDTLRAVTDQATMLLKSGRSVLVYTALGPASDVGHTLNDHNDSRQNIGSGLGRILRETVMATALRRVIVAGGDTSSHAIGCLNLSALVTRKPLPMTPGSPLCTAYSADKVFNGLEIAMKGGQVGGDDYFVKLRDGVE
jgi:3-oxoisoapionate kinase